MLKSMFLVINWFNFLLKFGVIDVGLCGLAKLLGYLVERSVCVVFLSICINYISQGITFGMMVALTHSLAWSIECEINGSIRGIEGWDWDSYIYFVIFWRVFTRVSMSWSCALWLSSFVFKLKIIRFNFYWGFFYLNHEFL